MATLRFSKEIGGITERVIRAYLQEAGSTDETLEEHTGETIYHGYTWQARVKPLPESRHGSLKMQRLHLEVSGEDREVERVRALLDRKLIRIGG